MAAEPPVQTSQKKDGVWNNWRTVTAQWSCATRLGLTSRAGLGARTVSSRSSPRKIPGAPMTTNAKRQP